VCETTLISSRRPRHADGVRLGPLLCSFDVRREHDLSTAPGRHRLWSSSPVSSGQATRYRVSSPEPRYSQMYAKATLTIDVRHETAGGRPRRLSNAECSWLVSRRLLWSYPLIWTTASSLLTERLNPVQAAQLSNSIAVTPTLQMRATSHARPRTILAPIRDSQHQILVQRQ